MSHSLTSTLSSLSSLISTGHYLVTITVSHVTLSHSHFNTLLSLFSYQHCTGHYLVTITVSMSWKEYGINLLAHLLSHTLIVYLLFSLKFKTLRARNIGQLDAIDCMKRVSELQLFAVLCVDVLLSMAWHNTCMGAGDWNSAVFILGGVIASGKYLYGNRVSLSLSLSLSLSFSLSLSLSRSLSHLPLSSPSLSLMSLIWMLNCLHVSVVNGTNTCFDSAHLDYIGMLFRYWFRYPNNKYDFLTCVCVFVQLRKALLPACT